MSTPEQDRTPDFLAGLDAMAGDTTICTFADPPAGPGSPPRSLDVALTAIDSSNEVLRRANDGALEPSQNDETQYLPYKYTPFTEW